MTNTNTSESDWRDGFLFVGNHPALDFVNTRPVIVGEPQELLPDWRSLVRWFQAAGLIDSRAAQALERGWTHSSESRKTVEAMRNFREALRKELLAWEDGAPVRNAMIHELNRLMSEHPMLSKVSSNKGKLAKTPWLPLERPSDLFAPLADAAAQLFSELSRERVRKCAHCVIHFRDVSKIGTRRWCSLRLCGNRLKVAAYAARRKK